MKLLHLCFDGNFVENSMSVFEHFYPETNIWVIIEPSRDSRIINREDRKIYRFIPDERDIYIETISCLNRKENFDVIVCHGINDFIVEAVKLIMTVNNPKVYWIFWGYELYRALGMTGKMKLVDDSSFLNPLSYKMPTKARLFFRTKLLNKENDELLLKEFLKYADSFCFWFKDDYELLKKFYPCKAEYKFFQYNALWRHEKSTQMASERFFNKQPRSIIINHQASETGNHKTLLKKLRSFPGIEDFEIIAPLSYGVSAIRRYVCWKGKHLFGRNFRPVLNYMPIDKYNELIGKVEVAIFGQHRQEAAGNISFYLANGTKVFMREDSTLFHYFKNAGYAIFSFENDLRSIKDLEGLSVEDKRHNAELAIKRKNYYEDFMPSLFD